jgi:hypothetical protein
MTKQRLLIQTLGILGYISCIFQWLWTVIVFLPSLLENEALKILLLPPDTSQIPEEPSTLTQEPSLLFTVIAVIVTLIVIAGSAYVLLRLPIAIAKAGKTTTTRAARTIVPLVTHHKPLPPKKEKILTAQIVRLLKFVACIMPMLLLGFILFIDTSLSKDLIVLIGGALALASIFWFSLEYLLAKLFKLPLDKVF